MNQKEVLLDLFRRFKVLSNHDLRNLKPPIYQYPTRIKELREAGVNIRTERDTQNPKTFYYRLIEFETREGVRFETLRSGNHNKRD